VVEWQRLRSRVSNRRVRPISGIISCVTAKGLLNRAHAYKAIVEENIRQERNTDDNINAGLFSYPVLMAADILLFGTHEETRMIYLKGGARYSDIKNKLIILLLEKFKEGRRIYEALLRDQPAIERILKQGALAARAIAKPVLSEVRRSIGIDQPGL
jgi:tryptophanyl-tRNA synthetase